MPKKKVAVAISDWLLIELDATAQAESLSRSALVEEAVAKYVVRKASRSAEQRLRAQGALALEDMARFASEYDEDETAAMEPSSLEKLRTLRASGRGLGA